MKLGVPAEQNVPDFAPVRTTRYRVVLCATHRTLLGVKTPSSRVGVLEQLYCRVLLHPVQCNKNPHYYTLHLTVIPNGLISSKPGSESNFLGQKVQKCSDFTLKNLNFSRVG